MVFIADFHIHSKYSRATSPNMDLKNLARFAKVKGINLLGTGDFTHPQWLVELKDNLKPCENGLFIYKYVHFILTAEICTLFYDKGKAKKVHIILFAPSFEVVEKINKALSKYGNLSADGRPILKLDAKDLVKIILDISEKCFFVPAHIWTPHFSLFGANSGFDSIEECFQEQTKNIYALETGLSSDPAMNWQLSCLDRYSLISNSDSHSPSKIGREANVFDCKLDYDEILNVLKTKDRKKFLYTIEFFPEEGKYHFDGHRKCKVRLSSRETLKNRNLCPVCGKKLTIGVMHRINQLADRNSGFILSTAIPFKHLIPLPEVISLAINKGVGTISVEKEYNKLINQAGTELDILMNVDKEELEKITLPKIAEGIIKIREKKVKILPGYDGIYGKINILWDKPSISSSLLRGS
ncbi:DNA helicase UvrD [bacterium]|nr:DNA helicase UvrD [bacterium]